MRSLVCKRVLSGDRRDTSRTSWSHESWDQREQSWPMGARTLKGCCQELGAKRKTEGRYSWASPLPSWCNLPTVSRGQKFTWMPWAQESGDCFLVADLYPETRVEGPGAHPWAQRQRTHPGKHTTTALFRDVLVWKKLLVCRKHTAGGWQQFSRDLNSRHFSLSSLIV